MFQKYCICANQVPGMLKGRPGGRHCKTLWLPSYVANNCVPQKETVGQRDTHISSENHLEGEGQWKVV